MILLRIALLVLLACHVDVVVEGLLAIPRRHVSCLHHSREVMHPKGVYTDDEGIESYDSFGFSPQLRVNGFTVPTHVVFGTNAMEHGVNLLEEISREALVVHGWNAARLDTLLWELEPRGFQLDFLSISSPTPTFEDVADIVHALESSKMRIVIAVGGGCIIDAVKLAATVMSRNVTGISIKSPGLPVIVCSIPLLPAGGSEISSYSAIRNNISVERHRKKTLSFTQYFPTVSPDLCIIHPLSLYRANMVDVNEKILNLMATCFEIIVDGDAGYMSELLAQDALRTLVAIFDKAVTAHDARLLDREANFDKYFDFTVNDVGENDPLDPDDGHHRETQFFRRYGHAFDESVVVDICRLSVSVNSAKVGGGVKLSPMQFLADSLLSTDPDLITTDGDQYPSTFGTLVARMFPRYMLGILKWINDDTEEARQESPEKAYARVSVNKIAKILGASEHLAVENKIFDQGTNERNKNNIETFRDQMVKMMQVVDRILDRSDRIGPEPTGFSLDEIDEENHEQINNVRYVVNERDAYELSVKMGVVCGKDCIGSKLDPLLIGKILNDILKV